MKSRAGRNENEIPTARPDSLNANALTKKAVRNPESIADGGCAGRTDGRTDGRGHGGARVARASQDGNASDETRENSASLFLPNFNRHNRKSRFFNYVYRITALTRTHDSFSYAIYLRYIDFFLHRNLYSIETTKRPKDSSRFVKSF